jgi:rhamnogalacturonyl hydrolase YesR
MISVAFQTELNPDTKSAPWYDYASDTLWVGDSAGYLHEFTGVFLGTPGEMTDAGGTCTTSCVWPISVVSAEALTSPVYDNTHSLIFVGATGGHLYSVANTNTTKTVETSNQIGYASVDIADAPLVDPAAGTAGEVYVFVSGDAATTPSSGVFQFAEGSISGASGTEEKVGTGSTGAIPLYAGTLDNAYFTSASSTSPTGYLWVCGDSGGDPTLYAVPITGNAVGAATTGPVVSAIATTCSPVTEFCTNSGAACTSSAGADYIFVSPQTEPATGEVTGCTASEGCVISYTVTTAPAATYSGSGAFPGGASGMVVDTQNTTVSGTLQLYFGILGSTSCSGTSSAGSGTGGCAIQASQTSLTVSVPVPAPSIASLSPTSGPQGTLVTIVGANFGTAQGTVDLNGTAAPVVSWSSSSIIVAVPAGATSGNVVVTAGEVASNGVDFTVLPLQLPSQAQVLAAIEDVNNYWISNNVPGNSDWDQATYFTGDLAAYDATGQANYLSFAQTWATENSYSLIGGNTTTWPDYQAAGQVYIRLYQLSNNSSDLSGITESINGMVNSTVDDEWTWIDAINMSMPDFAELGSIYDNTNYYAKMYALYSYTKYTLGLYDPTTGLWWENSTYANTSTYWSRGNGWVFAAHAKVLSVLPTSDPYYAEYLSTFIAMAQALAARQQPGGYWNSDLGGTDYAGPESSGTSFFLYGLAWGLNNGILDQSTYSPVVEMAWNFLANTAIQPSGLLGYVEPSYASNGPGPTTATTTFDYGVGAFLLAGRQMALLTQ